VRIHLKYLLIVFTSSSTEASSITGLKGELPPLLTPSTISATETKRVAYQSSQGRVKKSLHEKKKKKLKEKRAENNPLVGRKNIDCNALPT